MKRCFCVDFYLRMYLCMDMDMAYAESTIHTFIIFFTSYYAFRAASSPSFHFLFILWLIFIYQTTPPYSLICFLERCCFFSFLSVFTRFVGCFSPNRPYVLSFLAHEKWTPITMKTNNFFRNRPVITYAMWCLCPG